jgi:hypothetical protein
MCILTIKKDENLIPLWAKYQIVVLGNHKDQVWSKSNQFAPVLHGNFLCFLVSLAVKNGTHFVKVIARMPFTRPLGQPQGDTRG